MCVYTLNILFINYIYFIVTHYIVDRDLRLLVNEFKSIFSFFIFRNVKYYQKIQKPNVSP